MYPLKMKPFFKDYLWGGTRLIEEYNKRSDLPVLAESWEISCHENGQSSVENGPLSGQTLGSVLERNPKWMGQKCDKTGSFPLIIKLIDARQSLSLQVHPDDEYARVNENGSGKNEMWYVAEAQPGAELFLGFEESAKNADISALISSGQILSAVRRVPARTGDCYCIPAGLLHAINSGIVIIEVQQASDTTYRVYDYGRKDKDGNCRELHIDKALDVLDTGLRAKKSEGKVLADWSFFTSRLLEVDGEISQNCGVDSFLCYVVVSGQLSIVWSGGELVLKKGETVFIPAGMGDYTLGGSARVMSVSMS